MTDDAGLYILLLSVHGRVRGRAMELGVDADTGGQVTYVVELARALIADPRVSRVDLVTRRLEGAKVDPAYGEPYEELAPGARIVRLSCGPRRYLAKESLWPHLEELGDNVVRYLRAQGRVPDVVHGHYADAGYVGSRVAALLNVPMVFTGHSLGRVKRERLLAKGSTEEILEKRYRISHRIAAEENALDQAAFVVASSEQEVEEQYASYDRYRPRDTVVIPPGVDLSRFRPRDAGNPWKSTIAQRVFRFLREPKKPLVLALSRPDPRKNVLSLIQAFAEHEQLRAEANLALVLGSRDDIDTTPPPARRVFLDVLRAVDRYDLYGSVAYPKGHEPEEVPDLYRLAVATRGVFVNPALTEPFGLTLLESAASGLPIVATENGGPRDILGHCENGLLVDPLDAQAMGTALHRALTDARRWRRWSRAGVRGVERHYSWRAHVNRYLKEVTRHLRKRRPRTSVFSVRRRLIAADRAVICDIDNTLLGDPEGLADLLTRLQEAGSRVAFGIATGRSLALAKEALRAWKIPTPTVLLTSVGTEIHYGPNLVRDDGWADHIRFHWDPDALREAMKEVPGTSLQGPEGQGEFKVSYDIDPTRVATTREIQRHLRRKGLSARLVRSHDQFLDVLPTRASKGLAVRHFALRWGLPLEHVLVAGDSGNDEEMLRGNALGVVVGNHDPELESLRGLPRIYFASGACARGIVEGIEHYGFLGDIRIPPVGEEARDAAPAPEGAATAPEKAHAEVATS